MIFPQFVISWVVRPILASIALYILVFFVFDLGAVSATFYSIFGLVLFLINGLLFGILLVMWRLKSDVYSIVSYSLSIMKDCVVDVKQVNKTTTKENRKGVLRLLFLGITHVVTIPMVTTALGNKIPLIGFVIGGIMKRILRLVAGRITFDVEAVIEAESSGESPEAITNAYIRTIEKTMTGLDRFLSIILKVVRFPIVLVTAVTFSLLVTLLLIVT